MLAFTAIIGLVFLLTDCKSEPNMKKQQRAFHVDANGDLLNRKGVLVKKAGDFKLEGGFYVDSNGEKIKRNIDKAKEKMNKKMGEAKEKMGEAKDKLGEAAANTKEKLGTAVGAATAGLSKDKVKSSFNKLFNTKAVGTVYALHDIAFDKKSHRLVKMSKEEVEGLAAALKDHPASRIQVQVHTADGKNKSECKEIAGLPAIQ